MNEPRPPAQPATPIKKPEEQDAVARSIAKPHAFAKPGSEKPNSKGTRFRAMQYSTKGRPRKKARDPRKVIFY